jgi:hypothetical protein
MIGLLVDDDDDEDADVDEMVGIDASCTTEMKHSWWNVEFCNAIMASYVISDDDDVIFEIIQTIIYYVPAVMMIISDQ